MKICKEPFLKRTVKTRKGTLLLKQFLKIEVDLQTAKNMSSDKDLDPGVVLDNERRKEKKNITDDLNMQQTAVCEKERPVEPVTKQVQ